MALARGAFHGMAAHAMSHCDSTLLLRPAGPADAACVLGFIHAIAEYEKLSHEVVASVEDIRSALAGEPPEVECLLAEWQGEAAGFALFHPKFSTFTGRSGLYLEDLFVLPAFRGKGIGLALFRAVIELARQRGCPRVDWVALDWNRPALDFYQRQGAQELPEWRLFRMDPRHSSGTAACGGGSSSGCGEDQR